MSLNTKSQILEQYIPVIVGKKVYIPIIDRYVEINKSGLKHLLFNKKIENDVITSFFEQLLYIISQSQLITKEVDKNNRTEILNVYRFYSIIMLNNEPYALWWIARETVQGAFLYDMGILEKAPI